MAARIPRADIAHVTIATINTKVADAVTAIEAGDYATAKTKLLAAKALMAVKPTRSAKEGAEIEFDAGAIDSLLARISAELSAAHGVQTSLVKFTNPNEDE
jgi:cellobiose-specific phosphotransferase system component IIA